MTASITNIERCPDIVVLEGIYQDAIGDNLLFHITVPKRELAKIFVVLENGPLRG